VGQFFGILIIKKSPPLVYCAFIVRLLGGK
jgi:hypothetical protein